MVFQSMGARYSLGSALSHLFTVGTRVAKEQLMNDLSKRYGGKTTLFYKGRDALAAGIQAATDGDADVVVTGLTCYSVVQAVEAAGCTPVYADIRTQDLHYGPDELEAILAKNPRVKAVIVQNMLGIPADIVGIEKLCLKYKLALIEDLAHAAGATYADGREVGTVGDITMLSFGKDKAVDCVNGGALIVRNTQLTFDRDATTSPRFVDGMRDRIYPLISWLARSLFAIGGKYIMAAALRAKLVVKSAEGEVDVRHDMTAWQARRAAQELTRLDVRVAVRKRHAKQLFDLLGQPQIMEAFAPGASLARVPFLTNNRKGLLAEFKKRGIFVEDVWYDVPVSPIRYYERVHFPEASCPRAVEIAAQLINIPTHEKVTNAQYKEIASVLERFAV